MECDCAAYGVSKVQQESTVYFKIPVLDGKQPSWVDPVNGPTFLLDECRVGSKHQDQFLNSLLRVGILHLEAAQNGKRALVCREIQFRADIRVDF